MMTSPSQGEEANDLDEGDINDNDDLYDFTEDQIQAMLELDLMQRENSEYPNIEVRERLEELNNALANDPTPDDSQREPKVAFKEVLVDLIAPAPDYPSEEEEEEEQDAAQERPEDDEEEKDEEDEEEKKEEEKEKEKEEEEEEEEKEKEEEKVQTRAPLALGGAEVEEPSSLAAEEGEREARADEKAEEVPESPSPVEEEEEKRKKERKEREEEEEEEEAASQVLVERNGRYILTNDKAVEAGDVQATPARTPHPPATRRTQSAPLRRQPAPSAHPRSSSESGDSSYVSPYAMSSEMRQERQKRVQQRRQRTVSADLRRMEEEKDKKENADAAFQAWLRQKREQHREQRRNDDKGSEQSSVESQERNEEAMRAWLRRKRQEKRREAEVRNRQLQAMYAQQQLRSHSQEDVNKAFRSWLRRKNQESKLAAQEEKQRARITRLAVRQCRKSQALAFALQRDSSLRYVDYYGYRS